MNLEREYRGHTKLIKLAYVPEKIKGTIEKTLYKEMESDRDGSVVV